MPFPDRAHIGGMPITLHKRGPNQYDLGVSSGNAIPKIDETFEKAPSAASTDWTLSAAAGDIVVSEGNSVVSNWLVISLDPLSAGTDTVLTSKNTFGIPFEAVLGAHLSQRSLGQEFFLEFVSDEPATPAPAEAAIASIQQTATTLSVTTAAPHGLFPGMAIGIRGCNDSRMNYSALVVATADSATTFTATAGPGGTIPSVTAGPFTTGFVYARPRLAGARNGTSIVFENATATNAAFYVRSAAGEPFPTGTVNGNHSVTIASTASVAALTAPGVYAWQPTTEYRVVVQQDRAMWVDGLVDSPNQTALRANRTQIVPSSTPDYRFRVRGANRPSLTRPVAQIVSAVKTGTTTATITTDVPHGLTTADFVNIYGIRDQAASAFPNLTTATAVASTPTATTFTIGIGTAATVTSYGGYVSRVNGGQVQIGAVGSLTMAVQSVARAGNVLTVIGTAGQTWTNVSIGDFVNLVGVRDNATGASLGIDGAYRVRNNVTTTLTLEPINTTASPTGNDFTTTNCGGGVIRRTDLRLSYVRLLGYQRDRVEFATRPFGDLISTLPVAVNNTVVANVAGTVAIDGPVSSPVTVGYRAANVNPAAMSAAGDNVGALATMIGAAVNKPYSIPETDWQVALTVTNNTANTIQTAGGAGIKRYLTGLQYQNTNATATTFSVRQGTTVLANFSAPASMANPVAIEFPTPLQSAANADLNVINATTGANLLFNAQGYTAP